MPYTFGGKFWNKCSSSMHVALLKHGMDYSSWQYDWNVDDFYWFDVNKRLNRWHLDSNLCTRTSQFYGDGGIEKSHPCKLGLWPLFRCWVLCWMCGRACHCIHLAHLHEWDFSIPPLPVLCTRFTLKLCILELQTTLAGLIYHWFW